MLDKARSRLDIKELRDILTKLALHWNSRLLLPILKKKKIYIQEGGLGQNHRNKAKRENKNGKR